MITSFYPELLAQYQPQRVQSIFGTYAGSHRYPFPRGDDKQHRENIMTTIKKTKNSRTTGQLSTKPGMNEASLCTWISCMTKEGPSFFFMGVS